MVYTINEPAAAGAWEALKAVGKDDGSVMIVSIDGGCPGVKNVEAGVIGATSQQYPHKMASMALEAIAVGQAAGDRSGGRLPRHRRAADHRQAGRGRAVDLGRRGARALLGLTAFRRRPRGGWSRGTGAPERRRRAGSRGGGRMSDDTAGSVLRRERSGAERPGSGALRGGAARPGPAPAGLPARLSDHDPLHRALARGGDLRLRRAGQVPLAAEPFGRAAAGDDHRDPRGRPDAGDPDRRHRPLGRRDHDPLLGGDGPHRRRLRRAAPHRLPARLSGRPRLRCA